MRVTIEETPDRFEVTETYHDGFQVSWLFSFLFLALCPGFFLVAYLYTRETYALLYAIGLGAGLIVWYGVAATTSRRVLVIDAASGTVLDQKQGLWTRGKTYSLDDARGIFMFPASAESLGDIVDDLPRGREVRTGRVLGLDFGKRSLTIMHYTSRNSRDPWGECQAAHDRLQGWIARHRPELVRFAQPGVFVLREDSRSAAAGQSFGAPGLPPDEFRPRPAGAGSRIGAYVIEEDSALLRLYRPFPLGARKALIAGVLALVVAISLAMLPQMRALAPMRSLLLIVCAIYGGSVFALLFGIVKIWRYEVSSDIRFDATAGTLTIEKPAGATDVFPLDEIDAVLIRTDFAPRLTLEICNRKHDLLYFKPTVGRDEMDALGRRMERWLSQRRR